MGTNFYLIEPIQLSDGPSVSHVGKRSAAGIYCWDCACSLSAEYTEKLHSGHEHWRRVCPYCGKAFEKGKPGSAHVELGFAKAGDIEYVGVGSASSFTWGIPKKLVEAHVHKSPDDQKVIADEYERQYTWKEFTSDELSGVPAEYNFFHYDLGSGWC